MSIKMIGPINSGVAVGGAGVATNNADYKISSNGEFLGAYVDYKDSCPATSVVVIKTIGGGVPSYNLLALPAGNTDGLRLVRKSVVDAAGAALSFDGTHAIAEPIPFYDGLNIALTLADPGCSVDVYIFYK